MSLQTSFISLGETGHQYALDHYDLALQYGKKIDDNVCVIFFFALCVFTS